MWVINLVDNSESVRLCDSRCHLIILSVIATYSLSVFVSMQYLMDLVLSFTVFGV